MSKLIRKLQSKVLNGKSKDLKKVTEDPTDLQVDAVPTKTDLTVVPRSISSEPQDHHEAGPGPTNTTTTQSMNQANQFNSPSQTVYQFNHANGIHIGNNFTINQTNLQRDAQPLSDDDDEDNTPTQTKDQKPSPVDSKLLRKKFPKTRTIELLLKSDQPLEHPDMDVIATHLGEDWRSVARDLGFSNGEIDHFYEDNFAYGVKEV